MLGRKLRMVQGLESSSKILEAGRALARSDLGAEVKQWGHRGDRSPSVVQRVS